MFAGFFIQRPVFSTVTSLVIVIAGAVCIPLLPIAQFPELAPPTIAVSSFYVGANAQAVESSRFRPAESMPPGESDRPIVDPDRAPLIPQLRTVEHELRQRRQRGQRLRARLWPASLRWWRG